MVSVKIPKALRLAAEAQRLPCRIHRVYPNGQYDVVSRFGYIKGRIDHGNINPLPPSVKWDWELFMPSGNLGIDGQRDQRLQTHTMRWTVQHLNNRGSINQAQRGGRKTAKTAKPLPMYPKVPEDAYDWTHVIQKNPVIRRDDNGQPIWSDGEIGPADVADDESDETGDAPPPAAPVSAPEASEAEDPFATNVSGTIALSTEPVTERWDKDGRVYTTYLAEKGFKEQPVEIIEGRTRAKSRKP